MDSAYAFVVHPFNFGLEPSDFAVAINYHRMAVAAAGLDILKIIFTDHLDFHPSFVVLLVVMPSSVMEPLVIHLALVAAAMVVMCSCFIYYLLLSFNKH